MSEIDDGDAIPFDDVRETISAPVTDARYEAGRRRGTVAALRVRGATTEYPFPKGRCITLGSRADCDVVIDDPFVSSVHCIFERCGDVVMVRDHASKNGTFVNGQAIEGAEVRPGSVLTVGCTELVALAESGRGRSTAVEQLRGGDPQFRAAIDMALRAAATDCSVLVVGETGTGKELVARAVHEASYRASGSFVAVNCGAIPRDLIGSELFGHERGAFTGAVSERDGCFVQADGGTLFLDELGELPLEQQPHLLRVLETRRLRRVGGANERTVDVRLVAATNRIEGLGSPGSSIRVDLYHRLAVVVVTLPPLRERMGDLDEIVPAVLDELAPEHGRRRLSAVAWDALRGYDWPGNVRELRQALLRAVTLGGAELRIEDVFPAVPHAITTPRPVRARGTPPPVRRDADADAARDDLPPYELAQRELMADALARCRSIRAAAEMLGMPKSTFAEKAERWGLLDQRRGRRREEGTE